MEDAVDLAAQPAVASEEDACAICFDALSECGGAAQLPCNCRVDYCNRCWDRALNSRFSAVKRAECPTCRTPMFVNFNAASGRLMFEKSDGTPDPKMRDRLYEQARPRQVRLLQQHGEQHLAAPGGLGGASQVGPSCVCGSRLVSCSTRDRLICLLLQIGPGELAAAAEKVTPRVEARLEAIMERDKMPMLCDICDKEFKPGSRTWTCENGHKTILHGLAYDVCEACFMKHVHRVDLVEVEQQLRGGRRRSRSNSRTPPGGARSRSSSAQPNRPPGWRP
eukprot:TRINITY_DN73511_c0_g1_i2.p1 TRINITY_DN73511_c0_g1~~TRINITY_DN73511_c0_g1_i2.p1  ORF type:complete len:293 (+),score=41.56 TRINITY_DN73511_c0_g1_i2:45-881(+)